MTSKLTTGEIEFTSTTTVDVKTAAGYKVIINFIPKECEVFQIKIPNIVGMNVKKYQDYAQAFDDVGNSDSTLGKCGTRSYSLTDSSGVASTLSWVNVVKISSGPDKYEI